MLLTCTCACINTIWNEIKLECVHTVNDSSEDGKPQQKSNSTDSAPPAETLIPIAGLGMDLQYLLKQDCPVPFDIHFQLDDGSILGAHSVVVCARCSWFMNALER